MNGIRLTLSGVGLVATAALFTTAAVGQGGDTIGTATVIGALPYNTTGTTTGYVNDYDEQCPYTGSLSNDVVYAFSPGADMMVDITLCADSQYDTKLYVYENAHTPGAPFACNDDACTTPAGQNWVSELLGLYFLAGNTYYIVVDGYGSQNGDYTFDMSEAVPPTGACCVNEICVATNTLPECDALGGVWYEGEDCATFMCPEVEDCDPESIYSQIPTDPNGGWTAGTSDLNAGGGYNRYEDYAVTEDIAGLWFWGLTLSYPWAACTEDPMDFEIIFWPDDGTGMPDVANPACTYNLSLSGIVTSYLYAGFQVYRWETDLDPCCTLQEGWMSVQGTFLQTPTDCWFLWCSSGETGAGASWFWDGTAFVADTFDLSMCLMPCGAPPPSAYFDIKPGSCPNPFNTKAQGKFPTALLGTADFDVMLVNPMSLTLARADGVGGSVMPVKFSYEDVATPFTGDLCDCHAEEADGYLDMTIKFSRPEMTDVLELEGMTGDLELVLSGELLDGTPFSGADCIMFVPMNEEAPGPDSNDGR